MHWDLAPLTFIVLLFFYRVKAGLYFESASIIITLILLGRFFESKAKGKAGEAIRKLMDLQPKIARVVRDGETRDIPIIEVKVDECIVIRPGERIPVDGAITEGKLLQLMNQC